VCVRVVNPQPGQVPVDRGISFSGQLPNVHVALLDVVPRVAGYTRQWRDKQLSTAAAAAGGGGGVPGAALPGGAAAAGCCGAVGAAAAAAAAAGDGASSARQTAQNGGVHPLEQGPGYVHHVSSDLVGRVIGPGGTQIREIRDRTGARVRVSNDKIAGTNDRAVTIWGSDEQVHAPRRMLSVCMRRAAYLRRAIPF